MSNDGPSLADALSECRTLHSRYQKYLKTYGHQDTETQNIHKTLHTLLISFIIKYLLSPSCTTPSWSCDDISAGGSGGGDMLDLWWKTCVHAPIDYYRRLIGGGSGNVKWTVSELERLIECAYCSLVDCLMVASDCDRGSGGATNPSNPIISKLLIMQGDLCRYRGQFNSKSNAKNGNGKDLKGYYLEMAGDAYMQAFSKNPADGHAAHQLAIVHCLLSSVGDGVGWEAVWWYLVAGGGIKPFGAALANLRAYLQKQKRDAHSAADLLECIMACVDNDGGKDDGLLTFDHDEVIDSFASKVDFHFLLLSLLCCCCYGTENGCLGVKQCIRALFTKIERMFNDGSFDGDKEDHNEGNLLTCLLLAQYLGYLRLPENGVSIGNKIILERLHKKERSKFYSILAKNEFYLRVRQCWIFAGFEAWVRRSGTGADTASHQNTINGNISNNDSSAIASVEKEQRAASNDCKSILVDSDHQSSAKAVYSLPPPSPPPKNTATTQSCKKDHSIDSSVNARLSHSDLLQCSEDEEEDFVTFKGFGTIN